MTKSKTVSILGTGWLGLPLARHFLSAGYRVKGSTTSQRRLAELSALGVEPYVIDVDRMSGNYKGFLQADILIINIPSKNLEGFSALLEAIERSEVENVLFVSSTSVYENSNKTVTESDGKKSARNPLSAIEMLFENSDKVKTTIVRFGGLIGYSRNPGRFFRNGKTVAHPDAPVNLIHRDDCIGIISQIVGQEVWGEVFNGCADTHPTKREFYTHAAESAGSDVPEFADSGAAPFKVISNQKVKQVLNYGFLHPDLMKIAFDDH